MKESLSDSRASSPAIYSISSAEPAPEGKEDEGCPFPLNDFAHESRN